MCILVRMTTQEFYKALEEAMLADETITGDENLEDVGLWDSLARLNFQALVDLHFGTSVDAVKLKTVTKVSELTDFVRPYLQDSAE